MKKLMPALIILLGLIIIPSAIAETATVLVYMCGSTLESDGGFGSADLQEMMDANVSEESGVRILVETGGSEDWENESIDEDRICRYEIRNGELQTLDTLRLSNMGRARTLQDFLSFGIGEAPADRYILVLWGHGSGATGGVCIDDLYYGDSLMADEIASALEDGLDGTKLDCILFDACMMSCIEFAEAASPYADYMVAGQEMTSGNGLCYDQWLKLLAEDPEIDSTELYTFVADSYIEDNRLNLYDDGYALSVLDLSQIPALTTAVNKLYAALDDWLETAPDIVLAHRQKMMSFGEFIGEDPSDFVDAQKVAEVFFDLEPQACAAVRRAVSDAVVYNAVTQSMEGEANGISLTMPYATLDQIYLIYDTYDPLYKSSDYARMIVDMAELVEERGIQAKSSAREAIIPKEEMWTGLPDAA